MMGQRVSKSATVVGQRWNAEQRAFKVIDRNQIKPSVAPRHETSQENARVNEATSTEIEAQQQKNDLLAAMLKGANVNPDKMGEIVSKTRPLPQNTDAVEESEFGYLEPAVPITGKCSIKEAMQFISEYQKAPQENTLNALSEKYQMDIPVMSNITTHFQMLNVQMEEKKALSTGKKLKAKLKLPDYKKLGIGTPGGVLSDNKDQKSLPSHDSNSIKDSTSR